MTVDKDLASVISALPFNRSCLAGTFDLLTPDQDPGGAGSWLLVQGGGLATVHGQDQPLLPEGDCPVSRLQAEPLYLGQWQGNPLRMLALPRSAELPPPLQVQGLRAPETELPIELLSLGGIALMIRHWEESSRFCGNCVGAMVRLPGTWGKQCANCGTQHFPRIHPCVIGLVIRDDRLLLVRKAEWSLVRYGLVAGFVEFGESLEEAMAREVEEETNIRITNIRYLGSQSWPFPSQLMCGFVADYAGGEVCLNDAELCEAAWFAPEALPTLPPSRSIARFLIDRACDFMR